MLLDVGEDCFRNQTADRLALMNPFSDLGGAQVRRFNRNLSHTRRVRVWRHSGPGDDNKLNQVRANLTTKASDFVRAIRQAEELEGKNQIGSSLAWYLKAQKNYPASEFARNGIERTNTRILPDAK